MVKVFDELAAKATVQIDRATAAILALREHKTIIEKMPEILPNTESTPPRDDSIAALGPSLDDVVQELRTPQPPDRVQR